MKKKIVKILALCLALVLIAGVAFFANALAGNPVSKHLATKTAEKHIEEVYGDTDFVIESVKYSFKDTHYHANISSPSSVDTHFSLLIGMDGKLIYDNYEDVVLSGFNTMMRLEDEYRKMTDIVVESDSFPCDLDFGYGELVSTPKEYKDDPETPDYAIVVEDLTVDGIYDVRELAQKSGRLVLYVYDDTVTAERLAEILLDVKELFDKAGVPFYAVDCVLREYKSEDAYADSKYVQVRDFFYSDIYEDGMIQRVVDSNKEANIKDEISDIEKQAEILSNK